jgi:hypothetical protein
MKLRNAVKHGTLLLMIVSAVLLEGCFLTLSSGTTTELVSLSLLSGQLGYALSCDSYDFTGTLTKEELASPTWHLEGELRFPTSGYVVDELKVTVAESFPEQVSVIITVYPPDPGSEVAQVVTPVSVSTNITASNGALFGIVIRTVRQLQCGNMLDPA